MVLVAWFSSERGRPAHEVALVHADPTRVRRDTTPELVSRSVSSAGSAAADAGSLEVT